MMIIQCLMIETFIKLNYILCCAMRLLIRISMFISLCRLFNYQSVRKNRFYEKVRRENNMVKGVKGGGSPWKRFINEKTIYNNGVTCTRINACVLCNFYTKCLQVTVTKVELCSSSACSDPIVVLGSGSKEFDIASVSMLKQMLEHI